MHIITTNHVLVQNLEINSSSDGGIAFLVEKSDRCAFISNNFNGFQTAVINEKSKELVIIDNEIVNGGIWQTGVTTAAHSIINMNGESCYMADNEISNSFFGVWACDKFGTYVNNNTHGNYIGLILCNVPIALFLPSGELTGSLSPADNWKVRDNSSSDNIDAGYLVIDGAKGNVLMNNAASNNGTYDIELVGDSERFGFFSPTSSDNYVDLGEYTGLTVKDCGAGNTIEGDPNMVDTSLDSCF